MENLDILIAVFNVIKKCNIRSYPIDCFDIVQQFHFEVIGYSGLSETKRQACMALSEDACVLNTNLYYNDTCPDTRIRFSIMHELGHHLLNSDLESDANKFASNILAPRMAIHYSKCNDEHDVSEIFNISMEAAEYAFVDYQRWRSTAVHRMSSLDKAMYNHFYNKETKGFVFSTNRCLYCGREIHNQPDTHVCVFCKYPPSLCKSYNPFDDPLSPDSRAAGLSWIF